MSTHLDGDGVIIPDSAIPLIERAAAQARAIDPQVAADALLEQRDKRYRYAPCMARQLPGRRLMIMRRTWTAHVLLEFFNPEDVDAELATFPKPGAEPAFRVEFCPGSWSSIVASLGVHGETGLTFSLAYLLHTGGSTYPNELDLRSSVEVWGRGR